MYDVIVVGAGPAGSTAAKVLAEKGLHVLAVERHKLPRYKSCSGVLIQKTMDLVRCPQCAVKNRLSVSGTICPTPIRTCPRASVRCITRFSIQAILEVFEMKVVVSACIMGENCKYNGRSNKNQLVIDFLKDKEVIRICPERLAGMGTPRPCAEIVNGIVMDENGENIDAEYRNGVMLALTEIQEEDIDFVILQSRSPTCGVNKIYDGSFSGKLIPGMGLFAQELKQRGYKVVDVEEIEQQMNNTNSKC